MGWKIYLTIAGTLLALVFGSVIKYNSRKGTKAVAIVKELKDEVKKHKERQKVHGRSVDSDADFRRTLIRMRDSKA